MKTSNTYSELIVGKLYERCPKHVLAAIAVSALTVGGDYAFDGKTSDRVLKEWWLLYQNGIVPQWPPMPEPLALNEGNTSV